MRKSQTNTVNQTFSIPREVSEELHVYIKRMDMSRFVSEAIRKELEAKKDALRQAYILANDDAGQKETCEWDTTLMDGENEW